MRTGLIGCSIQASGSPAMHMGEAAELGLALRYDLFDLDLRAGGAAAFAEALAEAQRQGYAGVNVTHPCKQAATGFVQEISREARALGAINTIVFHGDIRIGHNTDWHGFAEGFRRGLPGVRIAQVLQLGAGGAGSATAYALLTMGCGHLYLYDAVAERAQRLCAQLAPLFGAERLSVAPSIDAVIGGCDGLVNTTPVGMAKYPGTPLPVPLLRPDLWVAEVVYFPLETQLLRAARALGCRTVDGGGMAVFQAAEAFRLFTGLQPDSERMLRAFRERLGRHSQHLPSDPRVAVPSAD